MTLQAALEALTALTTSTAPTSDSYAVTRAGAEPPRLHRVLLDGPLQAEFAAAAMAKAEALLDLTPRPYGPAVEVGRGEVGHAPADVGLLAQLQAGVETGDADLFDPGDEVVEHLRLLVTRFVADGGEVVTCYRELRPTARLDRSRFFAARWSQGRFDRVSEEHVLLFDRRFDAVVAGGTALYTSKSVFERVFDFLVELERSARETFTEVTAGLRIAGLEEMAAACTSNVSMMAKMASVRRRLDADPDYRAAMTMDRLVAFVQAHPETGVEVEGHGADAALRFFPDPRRRYKILRLLDDDYLRSLLTSRTYEAATKSEPLAAPAAGA